jgi:uncharacterized membrane protein YeiH
MSAEPVTVLQVPVWIDLSAVVVGALAGAVVAARERLDFVGVLFLAVVMGLGGGMLRDIFLGLRPVALTDPAYLPTAAAAALVGFFFATAVGRFTVVFTGLDALALGLFTVVGVEKALLQDLRAAAAILVGVAAATGGGIIRDLLTGRPVAVVRRGPWNAAAALFGAGTYTWLHSFGASAGVCEAAAFTVCVLARLLSVWRGWETPLPYDLTPAITRPLRGRPRSDGDGAGQEAATVDPGRPG